MMILALAPPQALKSLTIRKFLNSHAVPLVVTNPLNTKALRVVIFGTKLLKSTAIKFAVVVESPVMDGVYVLAVTPVQPDWISSLKAALVAVVETLKIAYAGVGGV